MAPRTGDLQGFAKHAVLSKYIRRVALELYRADRRNERAELSDLQLNEQAVYEQLATMVILLSDEDEFRPAVYAAADSMTPGGLGSLTLEHRKLACAAFLNAFKALKASLNGQLPRDTADLMRALVDEDKACGINAQPVNTRPGADLSSVETTAGVH